MTKRRWFGARMTESSGLLAHAFGLLLARPPSASVLARARREKFRKSSLADPGADASWTASLNRGDDLPPCRLSILTASGACSAMRLEPYRNESDAGSRANEI